MIFQASQRNGKMSEQSGFGVCPYLGLKDDATIMLSEPSVAHWCYAARPSNRPSIQDQAAVCLRLRHVHCQYYKGAMPEPPTSVAAETQGSARSVKRSSTRGAFIVAAVVTFGLLIGITLFVSDNALGILPKPVATLAEIVMLPTATSTSTWAVSPSPDAVAADSTTETAAPKLITLGGLLPTPTPELKVAEEVLELKPKSGNTGWWRTGETIQSGLNDSFLYAGGLDGQSYISAIRFDLSRVPRGAPILAGELRLTGLVDDRLNRNSDRTWLLQLVAQREACQLGRRYFHDAL